MFLFCCVVIVTIHFFDLVPTGSKRKRKKPGHIIVQGLPTTSPLKDQSTNFVVLKKRSENPSGVCMESVNLRSLYHVKASVLFCLFPFMSCCVVLW